MGQEWNQGGSLKLDLLKQELAKHKDNKKLIVMFTDSHDVILLADKDQVLDKFKRFEARVVFGAEYFCLPDEELKEKYPAVERGYKYLNSGGFIGYAVDLYRMLLDHPVAPEEDVQLYFTKLYLDHGPKYNIKLDHRADIFQNLHGADGK